MGALPIAVIDPVADREFSDLPVASISLNGSSSLPSDGASGIAAWDWVLRSKPPTSAAYLGSATTATPTLLEVDVPGSYLVSLKVTDNLGIESFSGIEPVQANTAPYGFTFPPASSMLAVRVRTAGGLVKVAYSERAWLEKGLWELVDKIDEHTAVIDQVEATTGSGQIYADDIFEKTLGHGIDVHHLVRLNELQNRTSDLLIQTTGASNGISLLSADTIDLSSEGETSLLASSVTIESSAGDIALEAGTASVLVSGGDITITASEDFLCDSTGSTSITSGGNLDVSSTSGDITIETLGSDGDITISTDGTTAAISLTTANADISLSALGADGDITLTASGVTGNINLSAGSDIGITATGGSKSVTLTASGTGGTVVLAPVLHTTSVSPVFAPGLLQSKTAEEKHTDQFSGNVFTSPPVFSRYEDGSELTADMVLAVYDSKAAPVEVRVKRNSTVLATFEMPTPLFAGWRVVRIKCSTRFGPDQISSNFVEHQYSDVMSTGGSSTSDTRGVAYHVLSESPRPSSIEFNVELVDAVDELRAQMTCTLANPHGREVL
jgi:hypothetical protein